MATAVITFRLPINDGVLPRTLDGKPSQDILDALEALADVMLVQAEDGLYTYGDPDSDEDDNDFLLDFESGQTFDVQIVDSP
jgi:hypothetical protein